MGKREPPKKPTAIKRAEGNPGHRPLNDREPQPDPSAPKCPKTLSKRAQGAWKKVVPQLRRMGVLTQIDGETLARYCTLLARYWDAEDFIKEHGTVFPLRDENGKLKYLQQIPQVGMANKLAVMLLRIEQEFGMTPSSRSNIFVEGSHGTEMSLAEFAALKPRLMIANGGA